MATPILSQPTTISQFQLGRYATLANQLEALKAEQSALQQQLIAALGSGAQVEAGANSDGAAVSCRTSEVATLRA